MSLFIFYLKGVHGKTKDKILKKEKYLFKGTVGVFQVLIPDSQHDGIHSCIPSPLAPDQGSIMCLLSILNQ